MEKKPKYEKVNEHVVRVTMEHVEEVPIDLVVAQKQQLLAQRKQLDNTINSMDDLLTEAKKLGIIPQKRVIKGK